MKHPTLLKCQKHLRTLRPRGENLQSTFLSLREVKLKVSGCCGFNCQFVCFSSLFFCLLKIKPPAAACYENSSFHIIEATEQTQEG